jgi:hypothetical protein
MIKSRELTDPNSCMSRAQPEEMTFVLLGRDAAAAATIRFWIAERIRLGKNTATDAQILDAEEAAKVIEASYDTRTPEQKEADYQEFLKEIFTGGKKCEHCGFQNRGGRQFCYECGDDLRQQTGTPTPPR